MSDRNQPKHARLQRRSQIRAHARGVITSNSETGGVTELKSKYSGPVETGLIFVFLAGLLAVVWVLYWHVINLGFVYHLVGDNYLARKSLVTVFLVCFVLFFYRPLIKSVLYHEQK